MSNATAMARFIATRFRDPISVADVADEVHLNQTYAMGFFRDAIGLTVGGYLAPCPVAEAQRLLITTAETIADISNRSGFGSISSFYYQFSQICNLSPKAYRAKYR